MKAVHRVLDRDLVESDAAGLCAFAVMTKAPRAGRVKTRLVPPLTAAEAAQLNVCFLRDTAAAISRASVEKGCGIAVYTPVGAEADYVDILPREFQLIPQRGNAFGERLEHAVEDLFAIGFASVCLIDSDSPTVPPDVYVEAARSLSMHGDRVVLGPSEDGGYYLIGLKQNDRRLFQDIEWSTERVLEQTKTRAAELGLQLELLPTCYDVDDQAGLRRLCDELLNEKSIDHAPNTRTFLSEIIKREGRDRIWAQL
jgi:rSAM/selenodomain-associated transferase 1